MLEYSKEKAKYPGQLPIMSLVSTTPVMTGNGATKIDQLPPDVPD